MLVTDALSPTLRTFSYLTTAILRASDSILEFEFQSRAPAFLSYEVERLARARVLADPDSAWMLRKENNYGVVVHNGAYRYYI